MVNRELSRATLWAALFVLIACHVDLAAGSTGQRPVVRIGHLVQASQPDLYALPIELMLQKLLIANRTILPDYDIVVESLPHAVYLEPGGAAATLAEALVAEQPYHAIVGPWSNIDSLQTVDISAAARLLHVVKGENAEFSFQRDRYPYMFRTFRSMDGIIHSWMYIVAQNSWPSVVSVWVESPTIDLANVWAERYNISNFAILAEAGADWIVDAWKGTAIDQIRRRSCRVVMTYLTTEADMYEFTCRVHRSNLGGLQYFARGTYTRGWFEEKYADDLGDCSSAEIHDAVAGYITCLHAFFAPGTEFGQLTMPISDGIDQSALPMTCMPGLTATDWLSNGELLALGLEAGFDFATLELFLAHSGSETDMVCAALLAVHDAIYNQGVELHRIEHRERNAFLTVISSMQKVDIQGPAGRLRFYNNSGDPEVIYYGLTQPAPPGALWNTGQDSFISIVTFPDGPSRPPQIQHVDLNRSITWRDGSVGIGSHNQHLGVYPDCSILNAELVWDDCVPCAPGTSYDVLLKACRTCTAGSYQAESGMSTCISSLPGSYIENIASPIVATLCPPGSECPQVGMVLPVPCQRGRFAPRAGLAECELCPAGRYQEDVGSTFCDPCEPVLGGSTTTSIASTSSSHCVCPAGTYRPSSGERCISCPEGMVCTEGSDIRNLEWSPPAGPYPQVEEGYMTLAEDPLRIYLCSTRAECPGGLPASCADHRDVTSVACGDCVDGAYERDDRCWPCGDAGAVPLVAALVGGLLFIAVLTFTINRDLHRTPASSVTIVAMTAMLFMSLQALGVLNQISIPWMEPIRSFLRLTALLHFDIRLLQISCSLGVDPVRAFATQQLMPILAIPVMIAALVFKKLALRGPRKACRIGAEALNATGTIYSLLFIAIVISALDPFVCYKHPSSSESMLSVPSLLCFESGKHTAMIAISIIALMCIPVPLLALCGYGVYMYPRRINSFDNTHFMHAFRFLFFRYQPRRYYFQCILLTRSLLLCLIPAMLRAQAATQVLCMCMVLVSYSIIVSQLRAWRSPQCNLLDACMNGLLSVMLTCGGLFLEENPHKDEINVLTACTLLMLLVSATAGICIALKRRFIPRPRYNFFICHHKAHAAAQARLLKLLLQARKASLQVFIDSDDLQELDRLFDVIKSRVKNFVIYLTAETLKRAWCAGEVVSAVKMKLHMIALHTPSFIEVTAEEMNDLESYIDTFGCNLKEYNIQWHDVAESYQHLLSKVAPTKISDTALGTRRFDLAVCDLLKQRTGDTPPPRLEQAPGSIVGFVTDSTNDEATAAAGILLTFIGKDVFQVCDLDCTILADHVHTLDELKSYAQTASLVIFLSAGCLLVEEFLSVVCEVQLRPPLVASLVLVNLPDFVFPSRSFRQQLATSGPPGVLSAYGKDVVPDLIKDFFKVIAVQMPTHASQQALETQTTEVFHRIQRATMLGRTSVGSSRADAHSRQVTPVVSPPQSERESRSPVTSPPQSESRFASESGPDNSAPSSPTSGKRLSENDRQKYKADEVDWNFLTV